MAPDATHADPGCVCDSKTFRRRAWCRAELTACWARNGSDGMYYSTNSGLRPLAPNRPRDALDVFGGDLTCCAKCHPDGQACDKELLVLPMLGSRAVPARSRRRRNSLIDMHAGCSTKFTATGTAPRPTPGPPSSDGALTNCTRRRSSGRGPRTTCRRGLCSEISSKRAWPRATPRRLARSRTCVVTRRGLLARRRCGTRIRRRRRRNGRYSARRRRGCSHRPRCSEACRR